MTQRELLALTGNLEQVAGVTMIEYEEGRATGMRACEVKNGPLRYTVLLDKSLDISEFSYWGIGFNFLSKPGLQGRGSSDTNGLEAQRSIMGGFMFTAGLENIGAPCDVGGKRFPMHGRMRTTPAEHVCARAFWEDDVYTMRVCGDMREAELFGENLTLHRSIETRLGEKTVTLTDTIANEAFRTEPYMILYHINIGYPLLTPSTRIYAPSRSVTPRDEEAAGHERDWDTFGPPIPGEPEYVFFHELAYSDGGLGVVSVVNEDLMLGVRITFTAAHLPCFMEWKSLASGDYALGIEPANASVLGRSVCAREGTLPTLAPLESVTNVLTFTVLEGEQELRQAQRETEHILTPDTIGQNVRGPLIGVTD